MVSAGAFVAAVWAFAFYEAVGEEALIVFAVQHLCVLVEDVAVFVDFHEDLLDEFFVDWAFGSGVVVEGCAPAFEKVGYYGVVSVRQFLGCYALFQGFDFYGCAVFV